TLVSLYIYYFFFSSRRRHTRFDCDWSSDVCSSDLFSLIILCLVVAYREGHPRGQTVPAKDAVRITIDAAWGLITLVIILGGILRSEERRVGKECRSRWSGEHVKKKEGEC